MESDILTRSLSTLMVLEPGSSDYRAQIVQWSEAIDDNGQRLSQLVRGLGDGLTSTEDKTREQEQVEKVSINRQQALILVSFYTEKCQDGALFKESLRGISALTRFPVVTNADIHGILNELDLVEVHAYPQSVRYLLFKLFDLLMDTRRECLVKSPTFLPLFIKTLDSEKDPRNLLLAFDLAKIILIEFSAVERYMEQLFDVTFCYFPITFKPPPDDPYGITADDLRDALHAVLSSNPALATYTMPALVEKLSSSGGSVRMDTMRVLIQSMPVYGSSLVQAFQEEIWTNLVIDIYTPAETGDDEIALNCLLTLLKTVSVHELHQAPQRPKILATLVSSSLEELKEPAKERAIHATRVLAVAARSSNPNCHYILSNTIIPLLQKSRNPDRSITEKAALLSFISKICLAAVQAQPLAMAEAINPIKDDLLSIFSGAVQDDALQMVDAGLQGISTLAKMGILDVDEGDYGLRLITTSLIDPKMRGSSIETGALDILRGLATTMPAQVQAITFSMLFSKCSDEPDQDTEERNHALDLLVKLSVRPDLLDAFVVRSMERVRALEDGHGKSTKDYICKILHCISLGFENQAKSMQEWLRRHAERLIPDLLDLIQCESTSIMADFDITRAVAKIVEQVSKALDPALQTLFCLSILRRTYRTFPKLVLEAALFGSTRAEAHPERLDLSAHLQFGTQCIYDVERAFHQSGLDLVASLVNRHASSGVVERYLLTLGNGTGADDIALYGSLARALLVRGDARAYSFIDRLLAVLKDPKDTGTGAAAARALAFTIVMADDHLSSSHHAVVKVLFRQRFYRYVLPKFLEGAQADGSNELSRAAHLQALGAVLAKLPKDLFINDLPVIMPNLLSSIQLPDPELALASVQLLMGVARDATEVIGTHLGTLIGTLLYLCTPYPPEALLKAKSRYVSALQKSQERSREAPPSPQPARLRLAAIQALGVINDVLTSDLTAPYKSRVIKQLGLVIDDRKKVIRTQAVATRAKWYL